MVGHGGSSAGSYLTDPTSPIPSHCASIAVTSTLRVEIGKDRILPFPNKCQVYMGDSREVPHVKIVRKLRYSCEDVNFASSIYSNTLKQFIFIVDYCLRLHITYKHSQTHSEHFL